MRADSASPVAEMIDSWKAGQIVSAQYHMGAPLLADSFSNSQKEASIEKTLTTGTPENIDFMKKLDWQAERLTQLKTAGVPVIWRPYHEMTGDWFWWGPNSSNGNNAERLKRLWIFTHDYYTKNKKLDNLIWNWNVSTYSWTDQNWKGYYPGDQYVDMVSVDEYAHQWNPDLNQVQYANHTSASMTKLKTVAPTKLAAIGENGLLPDIDQLFSTNSPKPIYFLTWWNCYPGVGPCNTTEQIRDAYSNRKTITADELPKFGTTSPPTTTYPTPPTSTSSPTSTVSPLSATLSEASTGPYYELATIKLGLSLSGSEQITSTKLYLNGSELTQDITAPFDGFTVGGAKAGTKQYYVIATTSSGKTVQSNVVSVTVQTPTPTTTVTPAPTPPTTPTPTADTTAPSAPGNVKASIAFDYLRFSYYSKLTWSAAYDKVGVTSYQVRRNDSSLGNTTTTNFKDYNIAANTYYTYEIYAQDATGNSSTASSTRSVGRCFLIWCWTE